MDILLQPSDYRFLNAGDAAMMTVAMRRLLAIWPAAHFHVLTDHPELLPAYSSRVTAVSNEGRSLWSSVSAWDSSRLAPLRTVLDGTHLHLSDRFRRTTPILRRWQLRRCPEALRAVERFMELIRKVDGFVVTGMGGLTSAFPDYTRILLDTLELALSHSIPTVLMGQGLGPIEDDCLLRRAAAVLPQVSFIALREGLHGPRLLRTWGMDSAKWTVTGDDALELATSSRCVPSGIALGVNLRLSDYSGVTDDRAELLRQPILGFAKARSIPLRILPISRLPQEADAERVQRLFGASCSVDKPADTLDSPERVIEYIQGCRIVITGSYHAGVFALAQGIPVIGLVMSTYYRWKFQGLAHQFPGGCEVVALDELSFPEQLLNVLERFWEAAPDLRKLLRAAADRQVTAGREAYDRLKYMVRAS